MGVQPETNQPSEDSCCQPEILKMGASALKAEP
jgi:hypothetical protein